MKLKDLLEKYGEYEVDLKKVVGNTEIQSVTIDLTKPKPKSVWELEEDDEYYYINADGYINISTYAEVESEENCVSVGNVFLVYEEAKKDLERRKVETLLLKFGGRRWFKRDNMNYLLEYDYKFEKLTYTGSGRPAWQGLIYFDTRAQIENAIEQIGEERIIKALFEVR